MKYFSYKRMMPKWDKIKEEMPLASIVRYSKRDVGSYDNWGDILTLRLNPDKMGDGFYEWVSPWASPEFGDCGGQMRECTPSYDDFISKQEDDNEFFDCKLRAPKWTNIAKAHPVFNFCMVDDCGDLFLLPHDNSYFIRMRIGHLEEYHGDGWTWTAPWYSLRFDIQQYRDQVIALRRYAQKTFRSINKVGLECISEIGGEEKKALNEMLEQYCVLRNDDGLYERASLENTIKRGYENLAFSLARATKLSKKEIV